MMKANPTSPFIAEEAFAAQKQAGWAMGRSHP